MTPRRGLLGLGAAAIALVALVERLRLPRLPFADPDSFGYAYPAVSLLAEGHFAHTHSREFPYPMFLWAVVGAAGDWNAVAVVQHVIGVAGGCVLLAAWMRIPLPRATGAGLEWTRTLLGLGLLAAYLFMAQSIVYEHYLRPESISQAVGALLLFGAVELVRLGPDDPARGRRLLAAATLSFVSAALLAMLRPQTLLLVPAVGLFVVLSALRVRPRRRIAAAALGVPLLLCSLGLWIPERVLARDDPTAGRFMAGVLFFWHFHLVDDVLEADRRAGRLSPEEVQLLDRLEAAFAEEQARHRTEGRRYGFQGYNPDALYYGRAGRILSEHFGTRTDAYRRFALCTFLRAIGRDPVGYAEKVGANLGRFYGWPGGTVLNHRGYYTVPRLIEHSVSSLRLYHDALRVHRPTARYLDGLEAAVAAPAPARSWLLGSERIGQAWGAVYRAIDGLYVPLLLAALLLLPLRSAWDDGALAAATLASAVAVFAGLLTAALAHGLETPRYVFALGVFSLFSAFTATLFVGVRALGLTVAGRRSGRRGRRAAPAPPPSR